MSETPQTPAERRYLRPSVCHASLMPCSPEADNMTVAVRDHDPA
jgi:hypothetical protein